MAMQLHAKPLRHEIVQVQVWLSTIQMQIKVKWFLS